MKCLFLLLRPLAHLLRLAERLGERLTSRAIDAYMTTGKRGRLRHLAYRLGGRLEAWGPRRFHVTARALGLVCDKHAYEAPGWWEFEIDCAGHDCRVCFTCAPQEVLSRG